MSAARGDKLVKVFLMTVKSKIALGALLAGLLLASGGVVWWYLKRPAPPSIAQVRAIAHSPFASFPSSLGWIPDKQGHFVTSGAIDNGGRIWVGSEETGLWFYQNDVWQHVAVADGLGENSVCALAADLQGRMWVGHGRRGVSVSNGQGWQNYDSLHGPLGSHVVRIAVCPASAPTGGDVWMATELGLARYSSASDTWAYYTRADGLPTDQASCLAFDANGDLYLGTECDGLVVGQAADNYKTWRSIPGSEKQPATSRGTGLPSNVINCEVLLRDGTAVVGTSHGLARSSDHGTSWTYTRGKDWIAKLKGSVDGPPDNWTPTNDATLAEDFIASLAEDHAGHLWVGFRTMGWQCLDEHTLQVVTANEAKTADYCDMILPIPGHAPLLGTRGYGLRQATGPTEATDVGSSAPAAAAP
jgi:ligand-binding sensor domain-containing protein